MYLVLPGVRSLCVPYLRYNSTHDNPDDNFIVNNPKYRRFALTGVSLGTRASKLGTTYCNTHYHQLS